MLIKDCSALYKVNAKTFADEIAQSAHPALHHPLDRLTTCLRRELIYWAVIAYQTG